ncbi:unnamed protein product [Umbelopsis ramanniana]
MYEMMGSSKMQQNFTIFTGDNVPITNVTLAIKHKRATLAAFLDIGKIDQICTKRKLLFMDRIVYCSDHSVQVIGEVLPHVAINRSYFSQRKQKRSKDGNVRKPQRKECDLSSQERSSLSVTEETIKSLQNELKRSNALCRQANELCHKWADQQKALKQQANRVRQQLKDERSKKYWMLQPEEKSKLPPVAPVPTSSKPGHEHDVEFLDISQVLQSAKEEERSIMFTGTDYGVVTMSTSVPMSLDRYNAHIKLYNRFHVLEDQSVGQRPHQAPLRSP